jgi:hypothetical protein
MESEKKSKFHKNTAIILHTPSPPLKRGDLHLRFPSMEGIKGWVLYFFFL